MTPTREELDFKGLFNSLAENRTPKGRCYAMQNASTDRGILEIGQRYTLLGARTSANAGDLGWGLGYGKFNCNETQRLSPTGTWTSGSLRLSWQNPAGSNQTTAVGAIAWNASATDVYNALQALSNIDLGDISVTGGPFPTYPIDVTFKARYGRTDVNMMVLQTNSLGGSTPSLSISERVKGGVQEEYLAVVQHNGEPTARLYSVHPTTGAYTELSTGLTPSNWFFVQYRDRIYAGNASDGLLYKQLGGSWSGSIGNPSFGNPTIAITNPATSFGLYQDFTSATYGTFSGWAVNPTIVNNGTIGIKLTLAANQDNDQVSFIATFAADQDWSYEDAISVQVGSTVSDNSVDNESIDIQLTNNDGSPLTIDPVLRAKGEFTETVTNTLASRWFHFGNANRGDRDNTKKVKITFILRKGTSGKILYIYFIKGKVWLNDKMSTINFNGVPTRKAIEYGYTYFKVSTSEESKLSPVSQTRALPDAADKRGTWWAMQAPGNALLTTSDIVRFYRRDEFGIWRKIGEVANVTAGLTTTFYDKNMLDELRNFDQYGIVQLPGGFNPETLGFFKQSLVVGADQKAWISAVGKPLVFANDPEDLSAPIPDETDDDRARTVFVADNRAEDVYAIVGQDSLYEITPYSSGAQVGDKPKDLSPPRRLPGSRGCVGYRAAYAYGGGVRIGSQDGLWYYSVGRGFSGEDNGALVDREESIDVRRSWATTLLGSSYSGLAMVEFQNEFWTFNGTKYLKETRNGQWEEGTFADSVYALHASRERGIAFMDSKGRIMKIGAYTDDNGTAATWSYATGLLDGPRVKIIGFEIFAAGKPRVVITVYDGSQAQGKDYTFDTPLENQVNRYPVVIQPGWRYRITFSGAATDNIQNFAIHFEGASEAKNN